MAIFSSTALCNNGGFGKIVIYALITGSYQRLYIEFADRFLV